MDNKKTGCILALLTASLLFPLFVAGCGSGSGGVEFNASTESGSVNISGRVSSLSDNNEAQGLSVQSLSRGEDYTTAQTVQGSAGTVVDSHGEISANGKTTNGTDSQGIYFLQEVPVEQGENLCVRFDIDGYAGNYANLQDLQPGESYTIFPVLANLTLQEEVESGTNVTLSDGNSSVEFQAGSLEENATADIYFGDPSTDAGALACPGDYTGVENSSLLNNSDSNKDNLISAGYVEISLRNEQGEEIKDLSKPANVTMELPRKLQNGSIASYEQGQSLDWWYFNSTAGVWVKSQNFNATIKEENSTLSFEAKVDRTGYWNAAFALNSSCLEVKVIDQDKSPLSDVNVYAQGLSYPGIFRDKTNDSGIARLPVMTSSEDKKHKVKLYARAGEVDFLYNATQTEGDQREFVYTPTGHSCQPLQNSIQIDREGTISGRVEYENAGAAGDFDLSSNLGKTATTDQAGEYSLDVPLGVEVLLFAPAVNNTKFVTLDSSRKETVDFVIPNRDPEVHSLKRIPEDDVYSLSRVDFYINATDPDPGDELSYEWNATNGSWNTKPEGEQVTWTAPKSDSGSAEIKVAVKDQYDGNTVKTETISWKYLDYSTQLKVKVYQDSGFSDPVSNATVVLYDEDDTSSINSTKTTNDNGVADFGNIGRERASISIIYNRDDNWRINSLMDIVVGEFKYNISPNVDLGKFFQEKNAQYKVDATLQNLPSGTEQTWIHPLLPSQASKSWGDLNTYENIIVTNRAIQSDGNISLLGTAYNSSSDLIGYGSLTDVTVENGTTYTIDMENSSPGTMDWTAESGPVQDVYILGRRKGVTYFYLSNDSHNSPVDSGNINIPRGAPMQDWFVYAGNQGDAGTFLFSWDKYDNLPQNVQIELPDYRIDYLEYKEQEKSSSWFIQDGSDTDVLKLSMTKYAEQSKLYSEIQLEWNLFKRPKIYSSEIRLPSLPSDIKKQIDMDWDNQRLNILDLNSANGYLDFIRKYNNGTDPFSDASKYLKGYRDNNL